MKNVTLKQSAASSGSSICGTFEQFGTQCHTLPHTHTGVCGMRQAQAQLCGLPCCQSFYTFWLHCAHIFTCKTKLQSSACQRANPAPRCASLPPSACHAFLPTAGQLNAQSFVLHAGLPGSLKLNLSTLTRTGGGEAGSVTEM